MTRHPDFDAVVLAGGEARRLGGADKPGLEVGGESLLGRVVGACVAARATTVTVVGPERPTGHPVTWTREDPPGGGPVPALAAGIAGGSAPVVCLLAADLPFADGESVIALIDALPGSQAALYTDDRDKDQPLFGVYRRDALTDALDAVAEHHGARLWSVLERLNLTRIPDTRGVTMDCDTWDRVAEARLLLAASSGNSDDEQHERHT